MPGKALRAQPSGQVGPVRLATAHRLRLAEPEATMRTPSCEGDQNMKTVVRSAPGQGACGSREEGTC